MYGTLRVLYRSEKHEAVLLTDRCLSKGIVVTLAIIMVGAAIAGYATAEQTAFQRSVAEETTETLDEAAYTDLSLVSIRYQYGGPLWFSVR